MLQSAQYTVYPGEYVPLPEVEALIKKGSTLHNSSSTNLPLNLDEFEDCFRLEIIIPGSKREEISIEIHDNILSITVINKECKGLTRAKLCIHEFDSLLVHRDVLLPVNSDIEFIAAEYKEGRILIHIPKIAYPQQGITKQVVIY